jgi:hypothetical protein
MLFANDMPTNAQKKGRGAHWLLLNEPVIRVLAPLIAQLVKRANISAFCLYVLRAV